MEARMDTNKLNMGLVITRPIKDSDHPLSELEKFTTDKKADIILFLEDYNYSDKLPDLQEIAGNRNKWIASEMEDRDTGGKKFKHAMIVNPQGEIVGGHCKTSLTYDELSKGFNHGDAIQAMETDFGIVSVAIYYEMHFPEMTSDARHLSNSGNLITTINGAAELPGVLAPNRDILWCK